MKNYSLMLLAQEDDEEEEEPLIDGVEEEVGELRLEGKTLQLSLQSREGLTTNQSFKVWGDIRGRAVLVLVDCGATCNFISWDLVEELGLEVEDTPMYSVEVGNGDIERNKGICKDLDLSMQGIMVKQHFFILGLGGTEVVLGMDWLASLGDIEANFKNLEIKWESQGN